MSELSNKKKTICHSEPCNINNTNNTNNNNNNNNKLRLFKCHNETN